MSTEAPKLTQQTEDNLVRARVVLLEQFPFFGELAKYLRPTVCGKERTDTACIDKYGHMYLNADFANQAQASDLLFVLAHEAMHLVNASASRLPEKALFPIWARAADLAINYILVREAHVPLPRRELIVPLHEGFERYWNKTHEEIYADLLKHTSILKSANAKGKWCDEESCTVGELFEGDEGAEQAVIWERRIKQAAETAKGVGKLPGSLNAFIATLGVPKKNWVRVLSLAAQNSLRKTYTWRKPNRRTAAAGIMTPSTKDEKPEVVLYLDTSGSMCDDLLNEGLTEIAALLKIARTTLILSDCQVYYCGPVSREQLGKLPMQRGGTDFNVVFNKITEEKIKPKLFIGFSDLEGPFPDKQPAYPVIWCRASRSRAEAPWGRLITM